jgi:Arc/MetJ-type ribon-helix-helix transcriptional regulator
MKTNARAKSSVTLPAAELRVVERLRQRLRAKSKVEVIRRALSLLVETTDRAELRRAFRDASLATRESLRSELDETIGASSAR